MARVVGGRGVGRAAGLLAGDGVRGGGRGGGGAAGWHGGGVLARLQRPRAHVTVAAAGDEGAVLLVELHELDRAVVARKAAGALDLALDQVALPEQETPLRARVRGCEER